jgi:hypothetical protein
MVVMAAFGGAGPRFLNGPWFLRNEHFEHGSNAVEIFGTEDPLHGSGYQL